MLLETIGHNSQLTMNVEETLALIADLANAVMHAQKYTSSSVGKPCIGKSEDGKCYPSVLNFTVIK